MNNLICAFLIFCSFNVLAGEWIADANTGCQVWNSAPVANESITWSGKCLDGKATGNGVTQWYKNGNSNGRFEGEYRDGKMKKGIYTYPNGDKYEGEYRDSKMEGNGTFMWGKYNADCNDQYCFKKFIGVMKNNEKFFGKMTLYNTTDTYEGGFNDNGSFTSYTEHKKQENKRKSNCPHVYMGKVFTAEGGVLGLQQEYQVLGFSASQGKATIKSYNGNWTGEISCENIPE
jgi:hypothetical protein